MKRALSKISPALKALLGVGIVAWMCAKGKLDPTQLARAFEHWPLMLAILGLGYCQTAIISYRWRLLLRAQEISLNFRRAFGLTMIGQLFNVAIPGSVGGDLVKGYYITRAAADRKTQAATSIVMDRYTGMVALFFLGAVMALANWSETSRTPATRSLGAISVMVCVVSMAGLYAALYAGGRLSQWTFLPGFARNAFSALHEYRRKPSAAPVALALSLLNQSITCTSYYLALRSAGAGDIPAAQIFLVAPLGFAAGALPLSPAGIGVGQAAFFGLFHMVAPAYAAAGTAAVTVFQAMYVLICVSGLLWYIPYKHVTLAAACEPAAPRVGAL